MSATSPKPFAGDGTPLSREAFDQAAAALRVGPPELWAVLTVETSGCGFLKDRRPKILFERHYFSRLTQGKHDAAAPDISHPAWSKDGYGPAGAHQYARLAKAMALDREAALKSASWGLGQVMGENCAKAGHATVQGLVDACVRSEGGQLVAMAAFIAAQGIDTALQQRDWAKFALTYNGPRYKDNKYDEKLRDAYAAYAGGTMPDLGVRAAQAYLTYKGFDPGIVDGVMGKRTREAIVAFQKNRGLPQTGAVDDALLAALRGA
jgi:hypothetical protein